MLLSFLPHWKSNHSGAMRFQGGDLNTLKVHSVEDIPSLYQELSKAGPQEWLSGYTDKERPLRCAQRSVLSGDVDPKT